MSNDIRSGKLGFKRKFGYAIGQMTDSTGFNVFYFFFLFFLTDYAGVPAGIAGTISLIAILWDAFTDPIVGYISDNLKSKHGRRRPLMIGATIPYAVCTFLLFNNVDFGENVKFVYFVVIAILFWSCYKTYVIPFFALGAELTDDFNERTSLRSWASVFMYLAVMLASAAPPMILQMAQEAGLSGSGGWNLVGVIFSAVIIITALICWNFTRGGELDVKSDPAPQEETELEKVSIFRNFVSILKLKPALLLGGSVLTWAITAALLSSGPVYIMTNNLGYNAGRQSAFFVFMTVMSIVWIPLINYCSRKFDKRTIYFIAMGISSICMLLFTFIGFNSFAIWLFYIAIFAFGNCTFWTVYYSMMYDISELDEFVSGKRREGVISALMSFFQKLGSALATWMIGMFLSMGGYDGTADVQPESAHQMILWINTLIPAIFGIIAAVFAFAYPLTGKRFQALMNALKAKREGREYTTDGFEKLL